MRGHGPHLYGFTFSELADLMDFARLNLHRHGSDSVREELYSWLEAHDFDVKSDDFAWQFEPKGHVGPEKEDEYVSDKV